MWSGKLEVLALGISLCLPMSGADNVAKDATARETASNPQLLLSQEPVTSSTPATIERQIEELKRGLEVQQATLRAQEARIAALEAEVRAAQASSTVSSIPSGTVGVGAGLVAETNVHQEPDQLEAPKDSGHKSFADRLKNIGPFSFSGDFKLRDEPSFGGPADRSQVRNRARIRLRFNADASLNGDVTGSLTLATGDINNPVAAMQTINQFYTRKPLYLDRAFITYHPHFFKALTLTGGKFSYPWYRTELTWDNDLNPEGLAQTLAWDFETSGPLKRIALVGFELPFAETAGVSFHNKSIVQSAVYGGQLQTAWGLTSWLRLSLYGAFYNWHKADPVALSVATANAASPLHGLLKLNNNGSQNSTVTTTGTFTATGQDVVTNAQFASKFGIFDAIARLDLSTSAPQWPILILGNFAQNTKACANLGNILAAPANTEVQTFSQSRNALCDPRQRRAYWLEARVGRAQEKGDWNFAYTRIFVEREAVLGVFNYSEMRQGSNVTAHRVEVFYQANNKIQLAFTGLFGRPLVTASSPLLDNLLKRLQFDVTYRF
ncbi:MAG TPA: putative porin [Candidatus Dormibacteraeota bacterium]|nr:putative porin [Candidatus Dormibacteraeota bacterium]